MSLSAQFEFLFVGKDEGNFLKNYFYELSPSSRGAAGPEEKMFINLEIKGNPSQAEDIGEAVFETMKEHFFAEGEHDPYARFEVALKAVNETIQGFEEKRVSKKAGQLNIIIAALSDTDLLLSSTGDSEAYLIRRRHVSVISDGLATNKKGELFTNIASGTLDHGDYVLLATTRVLRYLTKGDIGKIFASGDVDDCLEELKDFLSTEVLERIGMLGIHAQEEHRVLEEVEKKVIAGGKEAASKVGSMLSKKSKVLLPKVLSVAGSFFADQFQNLKETFYRSEQVRRHGRDKILYALIAAIVILVVGIYFVRTRGVRMQQLEELQALLSGVETQIANAETQGLIDKKRAMELLADAEQKSLQVLNSGYLRAKASQFLDQIQKKRDEFDNAFHITEAKVVADLSEKRSSVSVLGLLPLGDRFFAYEYNALYEVVLTKLHDPLTIDGQEVVITGAPFADQNSLIFLTRTNKVIEYRDGRFSLVGTQDNVWKGGDAVSSWGSRLYFLDPKGNQVWKYRKLRDGYSNAEPYFTDTTNIDIKNAIAMAIDSGIYVAMQDGKIERYYTGKSVDLKIRKEPFTPLRHPAKLFTDGDVPALYVLEPDTRRVVVLNKDLKTGDLVYSHQYIFDNLTDLRDLFYDKGSGKLYVADATKVYEVE